MPTHDEELKRFVKNPREEPDKKFSDAFKLFAHKVDLKEVIHNSKGTKSELERSQEQYIELFENDSKFLEKDLLKAKSTKPNLQPKHLGTEDRIKGGEAPKYNFGLQQFINQLAVEFKDAEKLLTPPTLKAWLVKNANPGEGYDPTPEIFDCDDIEFNGSELLWKDHTGSQKSIVIRSIDRYISRAK